MEDIHDFWVDCFIGDQGFFDEAFHGFPELFAHDDDWEAFDFSGLDEDRGFVDFVEGSQSSGHHDERVGVFYEHDFAYEEVFEINEEIEIGIRKLLVRQFDVAPDGQASAFAGAAVGGFHNTWSPPGHGGVSGLGEFFSNGLGELVILIVLVESCGPENGNAWSDEVEFAEPSDELDEDVDRGIEFLSAKAGAFEQAML